MALLLAVSAWAAIETCIIVYLRQQLIDAEIARDSVIRRNIAELDFRAESEERHKEDLLAWIQLCARQDLELERLRAMVAGNRRWLS